MSSPMMKAARSIAGMTDKVTGLNKKIKVVPGSISQLSDKLMQLEARRDKSFGVKNIKKYNQHIRKTHKELERLRNMPPASFMSRMQRMGGGMLGSMALVGGGVMLLRDSFKKFDIQAKADASIKAGLVSTNNAAGRSFEQLTAQAQKLQKTTLFGDEQTEQIQALMLTFKNVRTEMFDRSIPAIQDMATKMKIDGKSAAIQLGKALNDPLVGLSMLSRSGITFSESQTKVIKSLVKTGQMAKAQGIILDEVNSQFGGSAKAAALAGLGPWQQLVALFGDLQEVFAEKVLPGILKVSKFLKENFYIVKYGIPIIAAAYAGFKIYAFWTKMVAGQTLIWKGVNWLLNASLWSNPITWVVAGIIGLGLAIAGIIKYTEGWTAQWANLKLFFGRILDIITLSFKLAFDGIKLYYMSVFDGLVLAWKWTLNALGILSDEQYAKDKLAIKTRMQGRLDETVETAKKIKELSKFKDVGLQWKIGLKKDEEKKDVVEGAKSEKSKVDTSGGSEVQAGIDGVNGGGSKQTNINITIGKLNDTINVVANNLDEALEEIEDKIVSHLVQVVNRGNQLQGV